MTKVLTEADAAADLAGLPRAVSSEQALIERLNDECDLCNNEGAEDIATLLAEAIGGIRTLISERDALAGRVAELEAEREPKSLNALIADQLRPFLKPGDKVIWREAFRWHDDNGVMPNHYDGMSVAGLADEFGYQFDWDFNMNHAAIVRATKGGKL